jgi:hypothetical protein
LEPDWVRGALPNILMRCRRGVDLIQRTTIRDDRQVMLGYLFRDLASAERLLAGAPPELLLRCSHG